VKKDALAPGDSTVVELSFNTHAYKSAVSKNATIFSNDLVNSQAKIFVSAKIDSIPDPSLPVTWAPSTIQFTQKDKSFNIVVTNRDSVNLNLQSIGDKYDDLLMELNDNVIKPGKSAKIKLKWNGGYQKENYARSLTFNAGEKDSSTIFTIPFVVQGTDPTPEPVRKPVVPKKPPQPPAPKKDTLSNQGK